MMKPYQNPADLTFDEIESLQCPNCGGYKVKDDSIRPLIFALNILFTISSWGAWLLIWIPYHFISKAFRKPPTEIKVKCKLCGYAWVQKLQ